MLRNWNIRRVKTSRDSEGCWNCLSPALKIWSRTLHVVWRLQMVFWPLSTTGHQSRVPSPYPPAAHHVSSVTHWPSEFPCVHQDLSCLGTMTRGNSCYFLCSSSSVLFRSLHFSVVWLNVISSDNIRLCMWDTWGVISNCGLYGSVVNVIMVAV